MARYCFYCGRALSSGEKCNCRSTGASSASYAQSAASAGTGNGTAGSETTGSADYRQAAGTTGSHGSTGTAKGTASDNGRRSSATGSRSSSRENAFKRFFRAFNPFDSTPPRARQAKRPGGSARQGRPDGARAGRTGSGHAGSNRSTGQRTSFTVNPQMIWSGLRRLGSYLAQPADSIRQSAQTASYRPVLVILLIQGILGGLFLLTASNQIILRKLLDLSVSTLGQDGSFASRFFIFVQGFGISLAANLLLALIYQLALRFLFRQPVGYLRLLGVLSPSCLYFGIFILAGLFSLPASFFSALMMLMAGIAVATVAQFLAARSISGFDDNRNFILVALVMLVFTGVISMLLNLSLPLLVAMLNSSSII